MMNDLATVQPGRRSVFRHQASPARGAATGVDRPSVSRER